MKHVGITVSAVMITLLLTRGAGDGTPMAQPFLQSDSIAQYRDLGGFAVTVHVILQVHEHPDPVSRAGQDLASVAACQDDVVKAVNRRAALGVRTVVVEGLYAEGNLHQPEPIGDAGMVEGERHKAKWRLARQGDLSVYGFELKPLNEFAVRVVKELGQSVGALDDQPEDASNRQGQTLIEEELSRLSLWYAGVLPQRSFLALQTALAVALARGEKEVQLVIGRQHWSDLVYAANRHQDVRIRLVRYTCD